MGNRRGQEIFGMSFGMIFAIFLIIVTIAVSFYVISHFLNLNKCAQVGTFYGQLNDDVDDAWRASIVKKTFEGNLPSSGFLGTGIEKVCIGNPEDGNDDVAYDLEIYKRNENQNIFLYPPEKACDGELAAYSLKNVEISRFECFDVVDGKISLKLEKNSRELKVRLTGNA